MNIPENNTNRNATKVKTRIIRKPKNVQPNRTNSGKALKYSLTCHTLITNKIP